MTRRMLLRVLLTGSLLGWCLLFLRMESTEKSIVRAIFLEPTDAGWSAGLLYQFPEAAADVSETDAAIRFVLAAGKTPQAALMQAEEKLPRRANYRLCDYLILGKESSFEVLRNSETLFLERSYGRLSSRVFLADFAGAALETRTEEDEALPERLLELLKADKAAPHLYENRNGMLLPVLELDTGELSSREERLLLTGNGRILLTADQTEAALFLSGAKRTCVYQSDTEPVRLTKLAESVTAERDGFYLQLTCRCPPGSRRPAEESISRWETLCNETVALCWEQGFDLLRLGSVQTLQEGTGLRTAKNACPELRTDVVIF